MKKLLLTLMIMSFLTASMFAQAVKIPITVSNNMGKSQTLYFGLDPSATDGIDTGIGEATLPPAAFAFDARFVIPNGEGTWEDYRQGTAQYTGNKSHTIKYVFGDDGATAVTVAWSLPSGVTGTLKDAFGGILINETMSGSGSKTITNAAILQLIMDVSYNLAPPPPTKYIVTSSNNNPDAGTAVTITAQLADAGGNPISTSGKIITWSKTGTGGSFGSTTSTTDANGTVTVQFTVSQTAGIVHTVTATDNTALTGTSGNITTKAGAATKYVVTSSDANPVAGAAVTITAKLTDANNNPVATAGKVITWSKNTATGSFGSATSTTNASGEATIQFTTHTVSGTVHIVTATDNSSPALTGTSGDITTKAGAATKYVVTSSDANPVAGVAVTITAQLTDQYNNAVGMSGKNITWSKTGSGGSFNPTSSITDVNGKATTVFTVSQTSGTIHTVTATDNSTPALSGTSGNINTVAGAATKYLVTSNNYSPVAGEQVTISAQLSDQYGNSVATSGKIVTWSTTNDGTFSTATSATDATGKAAVNFTTSNTVGIIHKVTGTDENGLTGTANDITTTSGTAVKYIVASSYNNPTVGTNVTITAQLVDTGNNPKAEPNKTVTWSKTGSGGSFSSATSTTDATGKATVTFTVSQTAGTVHTVTATDNLSLTGTSGNITTKAGIANKYNLTAGNYNPQAGSNINITAQLTDQYGNNLKTSGKIITWSSTNGGTFSSATSNTDTTGEATITFTAAQLAGTIHTVTATDNSTPALTGTSGNITVKAGAASKYTVTSSDNNPSVGSIVTITAQLKDQYDNNVSTSGKVITWSKTGTGGSFGSTTSTTDANGTVTVQFTVSQTAGIVHTVTATDNTALTGTSGNITTKAGAATKYVVTSSDANPVAGAAVTITAKLTDANNNPVATAGKVITWSKNTATGSFGSATSTTNASGEATIQFTTHTVSGTVHIVTATDNSSPTLTGTSGDITTKAGAATKYVVTSSNNSPVMGSTVTVSAQLSDQYGNAVATQGKIVTWATTNGTLSSATSTTNSNGLATVQLTTVNVENTSHRVTATDNSGFTGASEEMITIAILPPQLVVPENGRTKLELSLTFSWQEVVGADGYQLQVATDNNFTNIISDVNDLTTTSKTISGLSNKTDYYWRVRSKKGTGRSGWSDVWRFTTIAKLPGAIVLYSPQNGADNQPINLKLDWFDDPNVDGFANPTVDNYKLQIAEKNDFNPVIKELKIIYSSQAQVSGLKYSTKYYWRVNATNEAGTGSFSTAWSFTTKDTLIAPSNLSGTPDTLLSVELTWQDNSTNEKGFKIERKGPGQSSFTPIAQVIANTVKYTDNNLEQGKEYKYRVKAFNDNAESIYSDEETVVMPTLSIKPPTNLSLKPNSDGSIDLFWKDNSNNEEGFNIEREGDGSSQSIVRSEIKMITSAWVKIASVPANLTQYKDNTSKLGVKYNYRVSAFSKEGISAPAVAPKPIVVLNAPSALKSIIENNSSARLTWNDNSDNEKGFIVLRADKPKLEFKQIVSTSANTVTYLDVSILDGKKYFYQVYVFNDNYGISATTNTDSVFLPMKAPTNGSSVQLTNQNKIKLAWKDNSKSEIGYLIERKEAFETDFKEITKVGENVETYTDETVLNKKTYSYKIRGYNDDTNSEYLLIASVLVGVEDEKQIPTEFSLYQNYPNPFNPSTVISYQLPTSSKVTLKIYDVLGREAATLVDEFKEAGIHKVEWNASNLTTGVYYYSISASEFHAVKKLILLK